MTGSVPKNEEVTLGNSPMASSVDPDWVTAHEFQTPVLKPGRLYEYEVQARWKEYGRERTRTQQVVITAGSKVTVDLTPPSGSAR
jgi:uncharacterized protein (TIGR03000 family)